MFFHQADSGHVELTPAFGYATATATALAVASPVVSAKDTANVESLRAEVGIGSYVSMGFDVAYQSDKVVTTPAGLVGDSTSKGLNDPDVFVLGRLGVGPGNIHYGATFSHAFDHKKIRANSSNEFTGGDTLTALVGYELPISAGTLGIAFADDVAKGDSIINNETAGTGYTDAVVEGGKSASGSLFYETKFDPCVLGFAFQYASTSETMSIYKVNGNVSGPGVNDHNAFNTIGLKLYGSYAMGSVVTLLPSVEHLSISYGDKTNTLLLDSGSAWGLSLGIRIKL